MRVAVFVECFPVISETFITRQITGLMDLGHEVDIYADYPPPIEDPVHPDIHAYKLLSRTRYTRTPQTRRRTRVLAAASHFPRCMRLAPAATCGVLNPAAYRRQAINLSAFHRLAGLAASRKHYDVLHAHFGPAANLFRFAKPLYRAPFVVSFHGYDFSLWPRLHGQRCYARLFRCADAVTVNSTYTNRRVQELGCPQDKIHKLPVSLDARQFPFRERIYEPDTPVRLLTVARLVEKKGIAYAIEAVARVREHNPHLRYDIIGDGPLRPDIEVLIRDLKLEGIVSLHGTRDGDYVKRMMDKAHLFMLTSVTAANGDEEGQGLVLQEAQASGLPVLATDHGPFTESIVPGKSGLLVPERDTEATADKLQYLLTHPQIWPHMGRAGRQHVESHFDSRTLNPRLVTLYQHANETYRRSTSPRKKAIR